MINKVVNSFDEAVADIPDGAVILMGGFGPANGTPTNLLLAVERLGVKNLTLIANTPGYGRLPEGAPEFRLTPPNYQDGGILIQNRQVKKVICSFPSLREAGTEIPLWQQWETGELEIEVVPQGTLAERIRAAKAGIGAFYIPTGTGTIIEQDKEKRIIDGQEHVLEHPLKADFALVRAYRVDRYGNCVYQGTSRNFNPVMAGAAKITIVEADELVELGELDPEVIVTPGIYIDRIAVREKGA